jgi:hypothetical protein
MFGYWSVNVISKWMGSPGKNSCDSGKKMVPCQHKKLSSPIGEASTFGNGFFTSCLYWRDKNLSAFDMLKGVGCAVAVCLRWVQQLGVREGCATLRTFQEPNIQQLTTTDNFTFADFADIFVTTFAV